MKISKIFSAIMAILTSVVMFAIPVNADEGYDDGNPVFALDKAQTYTVEAGKKNEIIFFIKNISNNDSKYWRSNLVFAARSIPCRNIYHRNPF